MSKSNYLETALLELLFNGTTIANIADDAGVGPLTNFYVSLHTADPGEAGDQTTNEVGAGYANYARVAVARTSSGFTVTGNSVSPTSDITFPAGTAGDSSTATHFGIGTDATGVGNLLYSGSLSPTLNIVDGATPILETGTSITED